MMVYPKGKPTWNKGLTSIYSEDTRRKIGLAASLRNKGRTLTLRHRKRIAASMKKLKQCSACSIRSRSVYQVSIPRITFYHLMLCDDCILSYYKSGEKLEVMSRR